jgi:hypothetical protein
LEAVMAQVLAKDEPLGTALEQMKAAQDWTGNVGHLITLSEAFWWQDVAPQIDEAIRERLQPAEARRYMADPERPALLQLIREHELGGRPVAESVDLMTGRSMQGARSIAAVLHGRLEKSAPPARGETRTWAERVPGGAAPEITEIYAEADAQQAEIGRQLAAAPEEWALRAWGAPPAEAGPLRADWERRAGLVGAYRQAAGITEPDVAIGPVPAGKGILRELFHASLQALQLPDDKALLKAMGRGELEAKLLERERAVAVAPPEVSPQLASVERQRDVAVRQAGAAAEAGDARLAGSAGALVRMHDGQLSRLRVADAAHREWAESHAGLEAEALAAEQELRDRNLAERIPGSGAEAAAEPREVPAPEIGEPELEAVSEAQFQAELHQLVHGAEAQPEAAAPEPSEPDGGRAAETEAQFQDRLSAVRAEAEAEQEARRQAEAEIRADLEHIGERISELGERIEADQARQAAIYQAYRDEAQLQREPEVQAEASLESSWQPGDAGYQPQAEQDAEAEMEL